MWRTFASGVCAGPGGRCDTCRNERRDRRSGRRRSNDEVQAMAKRGGRDRAHDKGRDGAARNGGRGDRPNRRLAKELGKLEKALERARAEEAKRQRQLEAATSDVARLRAEMQRVQRELAGATATVEAPVGAPPETAPEVNVNGLHAPAPEAEPVEAEAGPEVDLEAAEPRPAGAAEDEFQADAGADVPVADGDVPVIPAPEGLAEQLARLDEVIDRAAPEPAPPGAQPADADEAGERGPTESETGWAESTEQPPQAALEMTDVMAAADAGHVVEPQADPTQVASRPGRRASPSASPVEAPATQTGPVVEPEPIADRPPAYDVVEAPEPEPIAEPERSPDLEPEPALEPELAPVAFDEAEPSTEDVEAAGEPAYPATSNVIHLGAGIAATNGFAREAELVVTPERGRAEPVEAPEPTARSWP
jgi:hypothetical protein